MKKATLMAAIELVRKDFKDLSTFEHGSTEFNDVLLKHKLQGYLALSNKGFEMGSAGYELQMSLIAELKAQANDRGLTFTIIKGIGLNKCIYGDRAIRTFGDLDILVPKKYAIEFNELLNDMGFYQNIGYTSIANVGGKNRVAFAAINAERLSKTGERMPHPVKAYAGKPTYKAYRKFGYPSIGMHDGLYYLSDTLVEKTLREGLAEVQYGGVSFLAPIPEYAWIILVTTTYENSESFYSNTHDFGLVLRDYVDLRFFLKKYEAELNWNKVNDLVLRFGLSDIQAIVMGNLNLIYGKQMTCATTKESSWQVNVIDRMADHKLARNAALKIVRAKWKKEGSKLTYIVKKECGSMQTLYRQQWDVEQNISYQLRYNQEQFKIKLAIPKSIYEHEDYLYQFSFYPLKETASYTAYKVNFEIYDGEYCAYGHDTKRYNLGAIKKVTKTRFSLFCCKEDDDYILYAAIPFSEFRLENISKRDCLCFNFNVYRQHYQEVYHNVVRGSNHKKRLIKME